jgi:hypothetical protein
MIAVLVMMSRLKMMMRGGEVARCSLKMMLMRRMLLCHGAYSL